MAEQVGKKKKHPNSKSTQPKSASCLNTLYKTSHLSSAVRFILVSIGDSVEHELIMQQRPLTNAALTKSMQRPPVPLDVHSTSLAHPMEGQLDLEKQQLPPRRESRLRRTAPELWQETPLRTDDEIMQRFMLQLCFLSHSLSELIGSLQLGNFTADFWSSLAYESAEQQPENSLT